MQEARYEEQPNGLWRVWLPSGRELAAYADETEAKDVADLINLKTRIDANRPTDGFDADLDAEQIDIVAAMTMEELLERVLPEEPAATDDHDDDDGSAQQMHTNSRQDDEDQEDVEPAATVFNKPSITDWQKNADGSFSKAIGAGFKNGSSMVYRIYLNDQVRNNLFGMNNKDALFIYKGTSTKEDQQHEFHVSLCAHFNTNYTRLGKGAHEMTQALDISQGDVITLSKGPQLGQIYIKVDSSGRKPSPDPVERNKQSKSRPCVSGSSSDDGSSSDNEESWVSEPSDNSKDMDYDGHDSDGEADQDEVLSVVGSDEEVEEQQVNQTGNRYHWQRVSTAQDSYRKVLSDKLDSINMPKSMRNNVFGSMNVYDIVLIIKSSDSKLDKRRFECSFLDPNCVEFHSSMANRLRSNVNSLLNSLNAKKGDILTISKGPAVGEAYVSIEHKSTGAKRALTKSTKASKSSHKAHKKNDKAREMPRVAKVMKPSGLSSSWWQNSDGSYSRTMPSFYAVNNNNLALLMCKYTREKLLGSNVDEFVLITKSADPGLNGKRFDVGFSLIKGGPKTDNRVTRGDMCRLARFLNLKADDIVTLQQGPKAGELYISVEYATPVDARSKSPGVRLVAAKKMGSPGHHLGRELAGGGVSQKRQLPHHDSDDDIRTPPAKKHRPSAPSPVLNSVQSHQQQQQPVGTRAERSVADMVELIESIIEKEAVGLTTEEIDKFNMKFIGKMKPEEQLAHFRMLEKRDAGGKSDGVKLWVQMALANE